MCDKTSLEGLERMGWGHGDQTKPSQYHLLHGWIFTFYFLVHFNDLYHENTTEKGYFLFTDFPGTADLGVNLVSVLFRGQSVLNAPHFTIPH